MSNFTRKIKRHKVSKVVNFLNTLPFSTSNEDVIEKSPFEEVTIPEKVKGKKNGLCNRTACQSPKDVTWYNKGTNAYYCPDCAKKINDANQYGFDGKFVGDLCFDTEGVTVYTSQGVSE